MIDLVNPTRCEKNKWINQNTDNMFNWHSIFNDEISLNPLFVFRFNHFSTYFFIYIYIYRERER